MHRRCFMWLAATATVCAGCSSSDSCVDVDPAHPCAGDGAPAPWTSGTRVSALTYVAPDGFVTLAGRTDPTLGDACNFDIHGGAMIDCPPTWTAPAGFADAACTMPFFRPFASSPYQRWDQTVSGQAVSHYYHVTQQQPATLYDANGSGCTPFQNFQPELIADAEVDPATLALGDIVHHVYQGVGYDALETADGFSVISGVDAPSEPFMDDLPTRLEHVYDRHGDVRRLVAVQDKMFGRWCTVAPATSGSTVCVPTSDVPSLITHYTNDSCSGTPVYLSPTKVLYTQAVPLIAQQCDAPVSMTISDRGPQNTCVVSDFNGFMCRDIASQLVTLVVR